MMMMDMNMESNLGVAEVAVIKQGMKKEVVEEDVAMSPHGEGWEHLLLVDTSAIPLQSSSFHSSDDDGWEEEFKVQIDTNVLSDDDEEEAQDEMTRMKEEDPSQQTVGVKCNLCGVTLLNRNLLKRHKSSVHSREFLREAFFAAQTHPDPNDPFRVTYKCPECPRVCPSRGAFRHHFRDHHSGKSVCDLCGTLCSNVRQLRRHKKREHSSPRENNVKNNNDKDNNDPIACTKCGLRLPSYLQRLNHERVVHKRLTSTQCYFCGALFKHHHHLVSHITTHTLEKPFRCAMCGKEFRTWSNWRAHAVLVCGEDEKRRAEARRRKSWGKERRRKEMEVRRKAAQEKLSVESETWDRLEPTPSIDRRKQNLRQRKS